MAWLEVGAMQKNIWTSKEGSLENQKGSSACCPHDFLLILQGCIQPATLPPSCHHGRCREVCFRRRRYRAAASPFTTRILFGYRAAFYVDLVYYKATSLHGGSICSATSSHCVQLGSPPGFSHANLAAGAGEDTCTFSSRTACLERAGSGPVYLTARHPFASCNSLVAIIPSGSHIAWFYIVWGLCGANDGPTSCGCQGTASAPNGPCANRCHSSSGFFCASRGTQRR